MGFKKLSRFRDAMSRLRIGLVLTASLVLCGLPSATLFAQADGQTASAPTIDPPAPVSSAQASILRLRAESDGTPVHAAQPLQQFIAEATPISFLPAPSLALSSSALSSSADTFAEPSNAVIIAPNSTSLPLDRCPYDTTHNRSCRMHWKQMALEASLYLTFQNVGNAYTGYWYRWETTNGKWWDRYVNSVEDWRWKVWSDQNPFLDVYIGHPMMGAITNAIWEQNDPKGMTVVQGNNWVYYRSRLRATAFSTFFSFEWKLGPIGEAGMHNGDHFFYEKGTYTNETGWDELVTTPVGGLVWNIGEDYLDRTLIPRLEHHSHNPLMLLTYSFITPAKTMANVLRFRPPWYRDSREVKAKSFWSDPPDNVAITGSGGPTSSASSVTAPGNSPNVDSASLTAAWNRNNKPLEPPFTVSALNAYADSPAPAPVATSRPVIPGSSALRWGGVHEFGVIWGFSVMSGHLWGNQGDVKTMPIAVRYSYLLHMGDAVAVRYAPEFTALSMVDWQTPHTNFPYDPNFLYDQRTRAYGAGLSPIGFQVDLHPAGRVQPFFSTNEGAIYYDQKVFGAYAQPGLPTDGPRLLYVADFGAGINIFHHERQAITIGYRYQHMTGTNAESNTLSTDANVFYVGVSRFRTRHSKSVQ